MLPRAAGLTEQELILASTADYDLGSGYPQLAIPASQVLIIRNEHIEQIALLAGADWDKGKQDAVDRDLTAAVKDILDCPAECSIAVTYSGSIAIDRAIAACLRKNRRSGKRRLRVVSTSPSIDIIRDLLSERGEVETAFCESDIRLPKCKFDLPTLIDMVHAPVESDTGKALLLTSPENPTGAVWSIGELHCIAEACKQSGCFLVLDHCFLLAGVQPKRPSAVWDLKSAEEVDWIGIWDTGKTFGLNGEKLGFMLASQSMTEAVEGAIRVLQFDVSRRQKLIFTEILRSARYFDYVGQLRSACATNLRALTALSSQLGLDCSNPSAGSLALIGLTGRQQTDSVIQQELLDVGVGIVTGSSFFHGGTNRSDLLRVALAREPAFFAEALERMLPVLLGNRG